MLDVLQNAQSMSIIGQDPYSFADQLKPYTEEHPFYGPQDTKEAYNLSSSALHGT